MYKLRNISSPHHVMNRDQPMMKAVDRYLRLKAEGGSADTNFHPRCQASWQICGVGTETLNSNLPAIETLSRDKTHELTHQKNDGSVS